MNNNASEKHTKKSNHNHSYKGNGKSNRHYHKKHPNQGIMNQKPSLERRPFKWRAEADAIIQAENKKAKTSNKYIKLLKSLITLIVDVCIGAPVATLVITLGIPIWLLDEWVSLLMYLFMNDYEYKFNKDNYFELYSHIGDTIHDSFDDVRINFNKCFPKDEVEINIGHIRGITADTLKLVEFIILLPFAICVDIITLPFNILYNILTPDRYVVQELLGVIRALPSELRYHLEHFGS